MTKQINDILFLKGHEAMMTSLPFLPVSDHRITKVSDKLFQSACIRGYVATWEIKNNQLFLVDLRGNYKLNTKEPIVADWFSGEIIVYQGRIITYNSDDTVVFYDLKQSINLCEGVVRAVRSLKEKDFFHFAELG